MKWNTSKANCWFISGLSTSYIVLTCYQTHFKENINYYRKVSSAPKNMVTLIHYPIQYKLPELTSYNSPAPRNLASIITILTQLPIFNCYILSGASPNLLKYNPLQPVTAMIVTLPCLTTYNTIIQPWSSGPYPEPPWLPLTWNLQSGPRSEIWHFTLSWHPSCPTHITGQYPLTEPFWPSTIIILTATLGPTEVVIKVQRIHKNYFATHSFSILSDDRSKASSKTIPPHSVI
jgi:hypothetical protein